jgi:DMSO reductase family type II enzyme heme b subunit
MRARVGVLLSVPLLGLALSLASTAGAQAPITAVRVALPGPIRDPAAPVWRQARPVTVAIQPQVMAKPTKVDPAVKALVVRAVHNAAWIAFLLEWKDPTLSDRMVLDSFGDQVAVQLPVDARGAAPAPMMGHAGGRVNIMQWRAAFQRDIQQSPPTVRDLYPNAWTDVYPDEVLTAADARPYTGALGLENPISRGQASPVLDQMAEGWGSMTVKPDQHAVGLGVWRDGTWRVVIGRPMVSDDRNAPQLLPGGRTVVAFAVWEGGHGEVGARKGWAPWVPLVIAR